MLVYCIIYDDDKGYRYGAYIEATSSADARDAFEQTINANGEYKLVKLCFCDGDVVTSEFKNTYGFDIVATDTGRSFFYTVIDLLKSPDGSHLMIREFFRHDIIIGELLPVVVQAYIDAIQNLRSRGEW